MRNYHRCAGGGGGASLSSDLEIMGKVTEVTTRKTTMVWLLNHAKGDVNLHDFWTQTTALKLEHISHWGG